MYLLQAVAHHPERFAQPLLERALQLLVHGVANLLQLLRVLVLQSLEPLLDHAANGFQLLAGGFRQTRQFGGLGGGHAGDAVHHGIVEALQRLGYFRAHPVELPGVFDSHGGEALVERVAARAELRGERLQLGFLRR